MKLNEVFDDFIFLSEKYGEVQVSPVFIGRIDSAGNSVECQSIRLILNSFEIWIYYEIFDEFALMDFISAQAVRERYLKDEELLTTHDPELIELYKWFAFNKENRHPAEKQKENK